MKRFVLILLVITVAGTAFAWKFGGNVGVSVMIGTQLEQKYSENNILMYGFYVETINTLGKDGKVEFTVGARADVCAEDIKVSNFAISSVAGAGININFTNSFSMYVLPGLGGYFLTGFKGKDASVSDSELNLIGIGLMTGLRYKLGQSGFVINLSGSGLYPLSKFTASEKQKSSLLFTVGAGIGVSF